MFNGMEYVYEVYKERSFLKASQNLFISQPSLSATVKRIEQRIGYPIFDRSTKPLRLTECGEKYIQSVKQILEIENDFSNFINDLGDLKTGSLILGGSSLFTSWVLPPFMREFTLRFPLVKLTLVEESTIKLERLLQSGAVDLVIDNCMPDPMFFNSIVFQKEYLLLAVPKSFDINQKLEPFQITAKSIADLSFLHENVMPVPLNEFQEQPFIVLKPENDTRTRAMELCQEHGFLPRIVFEVDQQMTSYNITCSGMGISFISNTLISKVPPNPNIVYYKLDGERSCRNISFYWKSGRYFSKTMKEFLKIAGKQTGSMNDN